MATFLYNPDRKPKQSLIAEFVVRTGIYEEIMHDLETSKMKHPEQHYLLIGQRGAGKTTLLNRIKYGIEDSAILKAKVIPILFSEEQYNISELVNLWEAIAQYLEDYHGFEGLNEKIKANLHKANFEELSYDMLEKHLKSGHTKLVLLIDNIGDLLKKMDKTEVHRLREILQTQSEIQLIAGSPFYLETVLDYQQPLFEFFKVLRLDGLNKDETQSLLLKLAQMNGEVEKIERIIKETPERIETLRTLTGGVPRTIALMYNIFVEYNNEETVKDLERILDAVTPLYKHRMDDLPTQQQKIVDAVAKNWDGISVKELKDKLRIESKIISAQLRQLEKNQVIEKVTTDTKNHIYFLKERFFNIWYLMRYGRKQDKQRVIWLVKFLESWCSINEIEQRIIDYARKVKEGKLDAHLIDFYGEVYTAIKNLRPEMRIILRESAPQYLSKGISIDENEIFETIVNKIDRQEYEKALSLLRQIQQPSEKIAEKLIIYVFTILLEDKERFSESVSTIISKIKNAENENVTLGEYMQVLVYVSYNSILSLAYEEIEEAHNSWDITLNLIKANEGNYMSATQRVATLTLTFFLIANQPNIVLTTFEKMPEWKEELKPIYYATLKLLGKNDEVLKMGSELKEKVAELINHISDDRNLFRDLINEKKHLTELFVNQNGKVAKGNQHKKNR